MKASQSASDVLYDLYLLPKENLTFSYASTAETEICVRPTITDMAASWSARTSLVFLSLTQEQLKQRFHQTLTNMATPMFRTSSHHFFLSLKCHHVGSFRPFLQHLTFKRVYTHTHTYYKQQITMSIDSRPPPGPTVPSMTWTSFVTTSYKLQNSGCKMRPIWGAAT